MIRKTQDGISWLEFEQFSDIKEICHGVILRDGGSDDPDNVQVHSDAIRKLFDCEHCVMGKQVHGAFVAQVEHSPKGMERIEACDGLMTQNSNSMLLSRHADCQAVLFYDPTKRAIANVHVGWRGSVREVLKKTVMRMERVFGCKPSNLLVCISPSLGPKWAEFRNYRDELPEAFHAFQVKPAYFDFWEISRWQLGEAGVLAHHIEIAKMCTYDNPDDFFSYRREGVTGRHITSIALAKT